MASTIKINKILQVQVFLTVSDSFNACICCFIAFLCSVDRIIHHQRRFVNVFLCKSCLDNLRSPKICYQPTVLRVLFHLKGRYFT